MAEVIHSDLERLGCTVWRDVLIAGGEAWWHSICEQIRTCDLVVFVCSVDAVRSRYCLAEIEYALRLNRPVLPVTIGFVPSDVLPAALRDTHHVAYGNRDADSVIALSAALDRVLVSPAPADVPPPPTPLTETAILRDQIDDPELSTDTQHLVLKRLSDGLSHGDDVLVELARAFRARGDIDSDIAIALDAILERDRAAALNAETGRVLAKALLSHAARGRLTPIVGTGLVESLTGSSAQLARGWAKAFEFSPSKVLPGDLPSVAQYVRVMAGDVLMRESFVAHVASTLSQDLTDASQVADIDQLFDLAWRARPPGALDAHALLAGLPCPIYVTTQTHQLLENALSEQGKSPRSELCRWADDLDSWPPSAFADGTQDGYVPSMQEPLVFHLYGRVDIPDSLVLTEDDHFDLLVRLAEDRTRLPSCVRRALADSALLLLGLSIDDLEFKILWRALIRQEGSGRLGRYRNVAAQLDPTGTVASPEGVRQYLSEYFGRVTTPNLDIYWGSVDDFVWTLQSESQLTW